MWKLLRKDWLLNRKALGLTYALWSALWLGLALRDYGGDFSIGAWAGLVAVACGFLPAMGIARDDKFKAAALTCSLPVTRGDIVVSKYVGGWLMAVVAAGIALAAMLLLSLATGWPPAGRAWAPAVAMVVVLGTVLAFTMPFVLRFGIAGLLGPAIALQLAGMVVLLASALLGGHGVQSVESAIRNGAAAVRQLHATLGPAAFAAVALATVVALNLVSCRVSILVYRAREF